MNGLVRLFVLITVSFVLGFSARLAERHSFPKLYVLPCQRVLAESPLRESSKPVSRS